MAGGDLGKADLRQAHLERADLRVVNLRGAFVEGAHLSETNLQGADLSEVDLTRVKGLTPKQLAYTCGDSKTALPKGWTTRLTDCLPSHVGEEACGSATGTLR
jgi:uncharacterized protein YjbI with pentapeptide repeats